MLQNAIICYKYHKLFGWGGGLKNVKSSGVMSYKIRVFFREGCPSPYNVEPYKKISYNKGRHHKKKNG